MTPGDEVLVGAKVRLRAEQAEFYAPAVEDDEVHNPLAPYPSAGALAYVVAEKTDEAGFRLVNIRWDREDWRYNHQADGWAYPAHFEVIEPPADKTAPPEDLGDLSVAEMLERARERVEEERCSHCGSIHDERDEYHGLLSVALNDALDSDAFFLLFVRADGRDLQPTFYSASLSETATRLVEAQVMEVSRSLMDEFIQERLTKVTEHGRQGPQNHSEDPERSSESE